MVIHRIIIVVQRDLTHINSLLNWQSIKVQLNNYGINLVKYFIPRLPVNISLVNLQKAICQIHQVLLALQIMVNVLYKPVDASQPG